MSPDDPRPTHDAAEILAQRAWMRRFAAELAGAEGEDLAQETWLRVLARPGPALAQPRAWLASVMRNAARMRARGEERRGRREQSVARGEAEPSTDELAAQAELEQLAVRAVLELDEPYRETLLLRYVRGLEPHEIAARLGVPSSTVRNRVARGLELVRVRLDAKHGGERRAWLALFAPHLSLGKGAAAMAVGGGLYMGTKWIAGGVVLAAAVALLWTTRTTHERSFTEPSAAAAPAVELAPASAHDATPAPVPVRTAEREDLQAPAVARSAQAPARTELRVHVRWASDGAPAAELALRVESFDAEPFHPVFEGTTDENGTALFSTLLPGTQFVDTLRGANEFVELPIGEARTLALAIPQGLAVDCRVVGEGGASVAGAEVWLSDYGNDSNGLVVGCTDAAGRLFLRDVPGERRNLAARARGHAPSAQRELRGAPGTRLEVELVLPGAGAALAGLVQDARGTPLAGAEVLVGAEFPAAVRRADGALVPGAPPRGVTSDADGRFFVEGLAPGALELQARALGYGTGRAAVTLAARETARCVLVLAPEASVAGVVRDEAGQPLADVHVTGGSRYFDFSGREARSAADGSFVLRGLEAGRCLLGASSDAHGRARTELQLRAGEEARWEVVLSAGGALAGVVLDEREAPLEGWNVAAVERANTGLWLRSAYTDATGHFRLDNCPTKPFVLAVRAPEEVFGDPVLVCEDFRVGDETLVLRVLDAWRPSAFLEGHLVTADGAPLVQPQVLYISARTEMGLTQLPDAQGRFRIGPLRAGVYALRAEAEGRGELRTPPVTLAAGETRNLGTLVLEPCGWIEARALGKDGPLPAGTAVAGVGLRRDGESAGSISFDALHGRSEPLGAGRYVVHAEVWEWYAPDVEVEVAPGQTAEVALVFEPAAARYVEVDFAGVPVSALELRAFAADGRTVAERHYAHLDQEVQKEHYRAGVGGLLPGSYSIEVRAPDGRSATGALSVLDLAPSDAPLVLTLR